MIAFCSSCYHLKYQILVQFDWIPTSISSSFVVISIIISFDTEQAFKYKKTFIFHLFRFISISLVSFPFDLLRFDLFRFVSILFRTLQGPNSFNILVRCRIFMKCIFITLDVEKWQRRLYQWKNALYTVHS